MNADELLDQAIRQLNNLGDSLAQIAFGNPEGKECYPLGTLNWALQLSLQIQQTLIQAVAYKVEPQE
jgi:hypothetical protein